MIHFKIGRLHVQLIRGVDLDPTDLPKPLSLYLVVWRLPFGFVGGLAAGNPFFDIFLGVGGVELMYDRVQDGEL